MALSRITNPFLSSSGSGNASITSPSANTIAFTTATSEVMRINSAGNIQIGSTSYLSIAASTPTTPALQLHGTSLGKSAFAQYAWNSTNTYHTFNTSGTGGIGVHAAVTSADTLGNIQFNGSDGTSFVGGASIKALPEGTISTGVLPANLRFYTAAPSTGTLTERMRIDSNGYVGIGNTSPSYPIHVQTSNTTNPAGYFHNSSGSSNSPALIARGGANNAGNARIIIAQDYDGNEEFGISGTGELRVNAGFGSAGYGYVCRAWVNYSATAGSTTTRGSGNISSITYNAVGDHTLNFASAMPDANYALIGYSGQAGGDARHIGAITSQSTSAIRYLVQYISNTGGGGTAINNTNNHIAIFR